jgi:hypothetical protein
MRIGAAVRAFFSLPPVFGDPSNRELALYAVVGPFRFAGNLRSAILKTKLQKTGSSPRVSPEPAVREL